MDGSGPGYIYLLRGNNLPGQPIKIGRAKTRDRYKVYSVKAPIESQILMDAYVANHSQIERIIHVALAHRRVEGEWFVLENEEIMCLVRFLSDLVIEQISGAEQEDDWVHTVPDFHRAIEYWKAEYEKYARRYPA